MSQNRPETVLDKKSFKGAKIAIVQAQWNGFITSRLTAGAVETLRKYDIPDSDILIYEVPGAVELTFAGNQLIEHGTADAIIVFGCDVRGETPHFDYVCQSVTQGITELNTLSDIPVIFGVLTVENEQQALDRVGGCAGHKGVEAAETALQMIAFTRDLG